MMTREDQLNVLELLPAWQLKLPRVNKQVTRFVHEATKSVFLPQNLEDNLNEDSGLNLPVFTLRQFVSEDGDVTFLLAHMPDADNQQEADRLLQNIFKAMKVTCRAETQFDSSQMLLQPTSKVLIAMGERVANYLLAQSYEMAQWRDHQGKQCLQYHATPVVVTYCPSHLLSHHADKANTWADLCVAKAMLRT